MIIAILSVLILISMVLTGITAMVGASTAGASTTGVTAVDVPTMVGVSAPTGIAARAEPGDTTTTQPEDYRVFGKSITRPNEGMEPQNPGDPGGWLQSSLFFLVCGAVILMAIAVSFRARKLRSDRKEAGLDPVDVARRRGEGVRAPSPLKRS